MRDLFKILNEKTIKLPTDVEELLRNCKKVTYFDSPEELAIAAVGGPTKTKFDVKYDVPGKGEYVEAVVHKVSNGIAVNYTEAYMRRRDPNTMAISDDKPTDKIRFKEKYGYEFGDIKTETLEWLKNQELAVFFYLAGLKKLGVGGMAIAPANAGFFAGGLADLQGFIPKSELTSATMQCNRYILQTERKINDLEFNKKIQNTPIIKPRITLIYGRSQSWGDKEKEAYRVLNSSYTNLNIVTYDHLIERARRLIGMVKISNINVEELNSENIPF